MSLKVSPALSIRRYQSSENEASSNAPETPMRSQFYTTKLLRLHIRYCSDAHARSFWTCHSSVMHDVSPTPSCTDPQISSERGIICQAFCNCTQSPPMIIARKHTNSRSNAVWQSISNPIAWSANAVSLCRLLFVPMPRY